MGSSKQDNYQQPPKDSDENPDKEFWLVAIFKTFNRNLLLSVAIQYFNEGLMPMRLLSMKDIFLNKKYFAVEPAAA
jgi:hypothetical protein